MQPSVTSDREGEEKKRWFMIHSLANKRELKIKKKKLPGYAGLKPLLMKQRQGIVRYRDIESFKALSDDNKSIVISFLAKFIYEDLV